MNYKLLYQLEVEENKKLNKINNYKHKEVLELLSIVLELKEDNQKLKDRLKRSNKVANKLEKIITNSISSKTEIYA